MKKKVKKFAKGGFGGFSPFLGPAGGFITGGPRGGMGGPGMSRGLGGMGKLSNMSPRKIADLRSAAQQAGRGSAGAMRGELGPMQPPPGLGQQPVQATPFDPKTMVGTLGGVRNTGNIPPRPIQAGNIPPRPIQAGFGPISSVNSTTTQDMMGGDRGLGSVRNLGNLPSLVNARDTFAQYARATGQVFKKGGAVKASKSVSSASKRADGIATKGKTRGKMV